jgi:flagellar protein FliO/FliZ
MDLIPYDKIATLVVFLGALGLLWVMVQRHRGGLVGQLHKGRRLRLTESTAIGPADRAMILTVDGRDFLVVQIKGSGLVLQPLPPVVEGAA